MNNSPIPAPPDQVNAGSPPGAPALYVGDMMPRAGVYGDTVTIMGAGLTGATSVVFGFSPSVPTVVSDNQLTVTVPSGGGTVGIAVFTAAGSISGGDISFMYLSGV